MIHFFGILEPVVGKRERSDEAPTKGAFFGKSFGTVQSTARSEAERQDIEDEAQERQRFLFQSFAPQF